MAGHCWKDWEACSNSRVDIGQQLYCVDTIDSKFAFLIFFKITPYLLQLMAEKKIEKSSQKI